MTKKPSPEIEKPLRCPCGVGGRVEWHGPGAVWGIACWRPNEFSGRHRHGSGKTRREAVRSWNRSLAKRSTRGKGK